MLKIFCVTPEQQKRQLVTAKYALVASVSFNIKSVLLSPTTVMGKR